MGSITGHHGLLFGGGVVSGVVTLDPIYKHGNVVLSSGNLVATISLSGSIWPSTFATLSRSTGKYYFEFDITSGTADMMAGIARGVHALPSDNFPGQTADSYGYYASSGQKYNNNSGAAFGASYNGAFVIGIAVDYDAGKLWFAKNNVWQASGDPAAGTNAAFTGLTGSYEPVFSAHSGATMRARFAATNLVYSPPAGFSSYASGAGYLDGLGVVPRAVLSLRKLISTAATAIRVRRSSDNAEQDIGFIGDTLDTSSLATFVGANSAYITKFYDQTGNGEDLIQATASKQPRIVNAGVYDGEAKFDGTDDGMAITSLTMGAAAVGVYTKMRQPSVSTTEIIMEMSANYNSNAQSWVIYADNTGTANPWVASRNTTAGSDYRLSQFTGLVFTNLMTQITVLLDRAISGIGEIALWQGGSSVSPTAIGTPAEQTGTYTSYDLYVASRANASLYRDMSLDTLVIYNADTASIRASIEAIVA